MVAPTSTRPHKIIIIGNGACGKTCLLEVYRRGQFPKEYVPTVVDNFSKNITVDNKSINMTIWDTAGQEDYDSVRPLTYKDTDLVILSFSIESKRNFSNLQDKWVVEAKNYCPTADFLLVGLKKDVRDNDASNPDKISQYVETHEGKVACQEIGALEYIECSALTGENVDIVFETCARHLSQKCRENAAVKAGCCSMFGCTGW